MLASNELPSSNTTVICLAESITWSLVIMYPSLDIMTPLPSAVCILGIKNLSRATVEIFIATTDGDTNSIVLFKLGKYASDTWDTGVGFDSRLFWLVFTQDKLKNIINKHIWVNKYFTFLILTYINSDNFFGKTYNVNNVIKCTKTNKY